MEQETGIRKRHKGGLNQETGCQTGCPGEDDTSCNTVDLTLIMRHDLPHALENSPRREEHVDAAVDGRRELLDRKTQRMRASIEELKAVDEFSREHNCRMMKWELFLRGLGLMCLICPVLIVFAMLTTLFPKNYIEVLQYASQQPDFVGVASRLCLQVVSTARFISDANLQSGSSYLFGCCGALILLLLLVRTTVKKHKVLTTYHHEQIRKIEKLIEEETRLTKSSLIRTLPQCN